MSNFKNLIDNYGRSAEERAKVAELIEKVNAEAAKNWGNPEWRRQAAAVLTESILEGFRFETFYDQVIRVDRVGFTDRVFIQEETGLKVFHIAKGGHIEASSMVSESMEIGRDTLGFHVYEFEDHMEANFAKTTAEMRSLIVQRLDWAMNNAIKSLIEVAIDNASPYYVAGAGLSKPALDQAIRQVRDESLTGTVTLYGRSTMVDQIIDFPGYSEEALEEIRRRGRLGVYRGATIVAVRNWQDEEGDSFIPANELYVVADDAGLFATYGGLKTKEYIEADNWYWHYIGRQDFGGSIYRPERVRRFVDTSITP